MTTMTPQQMTYTRKTLEKLSKEDIITLFFEHQSRFQKVINQLARLKISYSELIELFESELGGDVQSHVQSHLSDPHQITQFRLLEQEQDKEHTMRNALRHVNDAAYLSRSSLRLLLAHQTDKCMDGVTLQQAIRLAVQAFCSDTELPNQITQQLRYSILDLTYFEEKPAKEIVSILGISEREYYRQLKRAIQIVAEHLFNV